MYFKITSVYNNYSSAADGDNNNINVSPSTSPRCSSSFGGSGFVKSPLNNDAGSYSTTAATTSCSSVTSGFDVIRQSSNSNTQHRSYQRESQLRRERTLSREEINALVLTKLIVSRFGESDDDSSRDGEE